MGTVSARQTTTIAIAVDTRIRFVRHIRMVWASGCVSASQTSSGGAVV